MEIFENKGIVFLGEQIGIQENELKKELVNLFLGTFDPIRAYLSQAKYMTSTGTHVVLCVSTNRKNDKQLATRIGNIFRNMFSLTEHLDLLFLNVEQERSLRRVCCPFYTSARFYEPDFFLSSGDGYLSGVHAGYKERRFLGEGANTHRFMICEVDPPILGRGAQEPNRVMLASRHQGYSIFPIDSWPCYVHVAKLVSKIGADQFLVNAGDLEPFAWAELYESMREARVAVDQWTDSISAELKQFNLTPSEVFGEHWEDPLNGTG